jgi:hypothetical protein
MDTFAELRKKAREIRDLAINEARQDYASRLTRIAALERELWDGKKTRYKRLSYAIESVIPKDRPFTTVDVYSALEAMDDRRSFKKGWVISHLGRLCDRGIIRRVQKNHGKTHAIYARAGVEVELVPFESLTLPLAVETILREHGKPLFPIEIAVRLVERGFRTEMRQDLLRGAVAACCRARPVKFRQSGKKWGLAGMARS